MDSWLFCEIAKIKNNNDYPQLPNMVLLKYLFYTYSIKWNFIFYLKNISIQHGRIRDKKTRTKFLGCCFIGEEAILAKATRKIDHCKIA